MKTCRICGTPLGHMNQNSEYCMIHRPNKKKPKEPVEQMMYISVSDFRKLQANSKLLEKLRKDIK